MAQYDIESILADLKATLVANLNTQISAINTEKGDGITLKSVDDSAYHLQNQEDRVELFDPFVVYGEAAEPAIQATGPGVAITYQVAVWMVLADNGTDLSIVKRLFRYRRALMDLMKSNWSSFAKADQKMKIQASMPTPPYKDMETGFMGRAIGVIFSLTVVS